MFLLSGQNLGRSDWFRPEKMALNLEERKSTATITVGPEAPEIPVDAWLLDDEEPGAGIVWLAKTVNTQYDTETRTAQLEHIVTMLKDVIMFGQVKPTDMRASGSTAPAGKCYAAEAITYILSKHSLWTVGTIDSAYSNISNPYNFNGDTLYAALETVTATMPGCYWDFDLSTVPFKINFKQLEDDVDSEMRMGRNITTMRKTVDKSRMYTRFYPIGKSDLHITGDYVSRNENTYGRKDKTETDQSKTTEAELIAWANERLDKHAEPAVTITISGLELSESTGESLDHFTINRKCRVPLPEFNTSITEKVTKLSWSDKISAPEAVTVTLANLIEDLASIINNANAASSRGGRTAAKDAKEDHAWFEDTTDHVAMIAEAVAGEGAASDWSRVASIVVDGDGIHQRVTAAEEDAVTARSWIEQNETSILQGVQDATGAKSWVDQNGSNVTAGVAKISGLEAKDVELEGRLDIEAGKASLLVTATDAREVISYAKAADFPTTGDANKLYYSLANKKYYEWKNGAYSETTPGNTINRAGIIATINQDGSSTTHIDADQVYIGNTKSSTVIAGKITLNDVTANYIKDQVASISTLGVNTINATGYIYADDFIIGTNSSGAQNNKYLHNAITEVQIVPSGTQYILQKKDFNDTSWVDCGTFKRVTSVSGSWSGNVLTISATGDSSLNTTQKLSAGDPSWSGNVATVSVYAKTAQDQLIGDTGFDVVVDASARYTAGAPKDITLGTKVTGMTWNVTATRGDNTTFADTLDLANVYTDARAGYYTAAQYNAAYSNGSPTDITLGQKSTGYVWNVTATRGDGTTFADTLDLASVYADASSGGSVTVSRVEIWYADGSAKVNSRDISSAVNLKPWALVNNTWYEGDSITLTPTGGSNPYPQTKTMTCTAATFTQGQWRYEFRITLNDANVFTSGSTYKFHNNSSYT